MGEEEVGVKGEEIVLLHSFTGAFPPLSPSPTELLGQEVRGLGLLGWGQGVGVDLALFQVGTQQSQSSLFVFSPCSKAVHPVFT